MTKNFISFFWKVLLQTWLHLLCSSELNFLDCFHHLLNNTCKSKAAILTFSTSAIITLCEVIIVRYVATLNQSEHEYLYNHQSIYANKHYYCPWTIYSKSCVLIGCLSGQDGLILPDLISCKKKFILDNTAMELQKVPEGSFNKENINDSVGFIVLNFLFQLLKKTSHSHPYLTEIFLQYRKSFIYQACSVKMTRY